MRSVLISPHTGHRLTRKDWPTSDSSYQLRNPPAPLRSFARDAKLTAALTVAVVELTVRLVKKWRKLRQPDQPKSA